MDANVESRQKRKMTNPTDPSPSSPSLLSLPNDIVLNCLARISRSYYRSLSLVSKSFHSILSSPEIYVVRSQIGTTEPCLYICLKLPSHHRWFTLDQTLVKDELTLVPLTTSPSNSPAPSKSTTVAAGSKIYQISERSSAVRVLDCLSHTWSRAPNMAVVRERAKSIFFLDGKIYVLGGCRSTNEPIKWGEVLDLKTQTWKLFSSPTDNALNSTHHALLLRGRLYINTENQRCAYDPKEGRWMAPPKLGFGFGRNPRPYCVIDNVLFDDRCKTYRWWGDSSRGRLQGLTDLYMKRARYYQTIQLLNYGRKLVILWHERVAAAAPVEMKRIWCAVIRLEKRIGSNSKPEIWGEIERMNVLCTVPNSYELLSCLSVRV